MMFSRLDVAVDDFLVRGFVQARRDLSHDVHRLHGIDAVPQPGQELLEILPRHVFLGDEVSAIDAADLIDLHDVGVDQAGGCLGLVLEAANVG